MSNLKQLKEITNMIEQATVTVSREEMRQWSDWLADRQQEQEQQMGESAPDLEMS